MIRHLVVNGCSYNQVWAGGWGPTKLAESLGLESAKTIALGGSNNSRILRTTLKHSYVTATEPTLYLVGLTFLTRWELPIIEADHERDFEGRWINPQSQHKHNEKLQFGWTSDDTNAYKDLGFKSSMYALADLLEDLMYRCIAVAADLVRRGHNVVFWNNCDESMAVSLENTAKFSLLKDNPHFVDGLKWAAIPWQHSQGVQPVDYGPGVNTPPRHLHHVLPEDYYKLNEYLTNWIYNNKILQ